jgi:hypothetical protein
MTIFIERVPLPWNGRRNRRYPWRDMQVGDSFFVPRGEISQMSSLAGVTGKRLGWRFTCRTENYGTENEGVRVWRIE